MVQRRQWKRSKQGTRSTLAHSVVVCNCELNVKLLPHSRHTTRFTCFIHTDIYVYIILYILYAFCKHSFHTHTAWHDTGMYSFQVHTLLGNQSHICKTVIPYKFCVHSSYIVFFHTATYVHLSYMYTFCIHSSYTYIRTLTRQKYAHSSEYVYTHC